MKQRVCFWKRFLKIDKTLASLTKKKRERTQVNKIKNERGEIKTDITEIHTHNNNNKKKKTKRILQTIKIICQQIGSTQKKWTYFQKHKACQDQIRKKQTI